MLKTVLASATLIVAVALSPVMVGSAQAQDMHHRVMHKRMVHHMMKKRMAHRMMHHHHM